MTRLDASETQIRGQFLDGFEVPGAVQFEHWKDEWRAKLMPRIRDSLVKQMDDGRRIGDFETVERHAQLLLELDPLSEDGVRGVMEARAWVGDRSNALKVYGRFETRLTEELGARPDARHRGQRKPGRCRSVTSGASRPNRSSDASVTSRVCMTRGSACDGASRTSSPCSAILAWERPLSRTRSCRRVRWRGRRLRVPRHTMRSVNCPSPCSPSW